MQPFHEAARAASVAAMIGPCFTPSTSTGRQVLRGPYSLILRIFSRSSRRYWNYDEAEDMATTPCNIRNSPKGISGQPFQPAANPIEFNPRLTA